MATTEEHSRRRGKHSNGEGEQTAVPVDRISDLPDAILCHILTFLPTTRNSVRTSVLAKRWRYLWAYVPNLVFRNDNQEFINRVMLVRKVQNIHTFHLYHDKIVCSRYQMDTWLVFAIMRNVQKLELCFDPQFALPRCLFTCETLVALKLRHCGFIPMSGAVRLPCLKKFDVLYIRFEADESLPHLLSGCPLLEELSIKLSGPMVYCNVSSPTIKRLVLDFHFETLEINTPALEYLLLKNSFPRHIKSGVLTSLIEACIIQVNKEITCIRSLLEFLDKLCNVKYLKLNLSCRIEIIDSVLSAWTTSFRNLTKLQLTGDIRFLPMFLKNADNLENLVFSEFCEEIEDWVELAQPVPTCLLSNLKIIRFNIKGKMSKFGCIEYLLRNAKVLERIIIPYPQSLACDEKIDMRRKISRFERGSRACKIAHLHKRDVLK